MTAKEYLMQVIHIDLLINSKLEQVAKLREAATSATNTLSGMPRNDTPNHQTMADTITKLVDLEGEINRDIDRLVDLKAEARVVINNLPDPEHQLVLELRYLCHNSWEDIAQKLDFSLSNVFRLHGSALKNVIVPKVESKINCNGVAPCDTIILPR